jgi:hypothetical protein
VAWAVQRPEVDRWLVAQVDRYCREATGLGFQAERLEIRPFLGRVRLHHLAVGDDLFRADLLEVDVDWPTLLQTPHIRSVVLRNPALVLDQARLGRIHLKPRPANQASPKVLLDRLVISGGRAQVREPAWGLPRGDFQFQASGRGWSANQLWLQLELPAFSLDRGSGPLQGDLTLEAHLAEQRIDLDQGHLRLGRSQLTGKGNFLVDQRRLSLAAQGHLDLAQAVAIAAPGGPGAPSASGQADFQARLEGPLDQLAWTGEVHGQNLQAKGVPLHPGSLRAAAKGGPGRIQLERLEWASHDGRLDASGEWTAAAGTVLQARIEAVPLAPVAGYTRTGFLKDLTARFNGVARLPGAPWSPFRPEQVSFQGEGQFVRDASPVGGMLLRLERGQLQASSVNLSLPELTFSGTLAGTLGPRGLAAASAEGAVETDAADVSGVLLAWDIGMSDASGRVTGLDMEGHAKAQAGVRWDPASGVRLDGLVDITDPRWHGARADRLSAKVAIDGDQLRLTDIALAKGDGTGSGELWLTWADLPRGAEQMDMCYQARRLPIEEGLRAADVGDLEIKGTGSGWVRLHGTYDRILLEGQALAEQGEVYGLDIPAASADFAMDIHGDRLSATDVRVADSVEHLGPTDGAPTGPLALQGAMAMDLKHETWKANLRGQADSSILGLPGPHLEAEVEAFLDGPFTAPLGTIQMPTGGVGFKAGRITEGDQSLEGLEGSVRFAHGELQARLGLAGQARPLLQLDAIQQGREHMTGTLQLELGAQTADTEQLAPRLTQNLLKDAHFRFHAQGDWGAGGLRWDGQMDRFAGRFEGFSLVQSHPGQFHGDLEGMDLAMDLEGLASLGASPAASSAALAQAAAGTAGSAQPEAVPGDSASQEPPPPAGRVAVPPRRRHMVSATRMRVLGRVPFVAGRPLDLELAGTSNLSNLKTLLDRLVQPGQYSLLADLQPSGDARFDLHVGGSPADATLDGSLTLQDGRLVVRSYPLSVENLDFTAQFQGHDIVIPKTAPLRGTLAQGALTAWGKATWNLGGISAYDLHTSLEDFQLRDLPDGFELQGSLDASLKGSDEEGGLLSGSVWATRTLYRTDINLSDLILANALAGTRAFNTLDPSDPMARIDLDLEVHLAEPWELDTNIVKMQGRPKGPFWIRGNLVQPGLKGKMELLPGGRLTNLFPAGDIVLERGTVEFNDPTFFNPNLDIQGQIDVPPYLVTLNISGTLDALQARPFSTPSLRQDEIFAILVDPSAVSTVGGAPGSSTQATMNTGLASTGTGLLTSLALANFQEQLRKTLNLDRVSVALRTGVGAPETSITLGTSFNLLGYRTPLVFTHDKAGDVTTLSSQVEWRFGDFVLRLGASQSTSDTLAPSGEIRHTWSPR